MGSAGMDIPDMDIPGIWDISCCDQRDVEANNIDKKIRTFSSPENGFRPGYGVSLPLPHGRGSE
jgi:hypothetical protein